MPTLRVNPETLSQLVDDSASTTLIICVLDLRETEDFIDLEFFKTGQSALDYLHKLDRPNASLAVVGVQIVLPPRLSSGRWKVEPVLDFTRLIVEKSNKESECYAYRVASGRFFADNKEISIKSIKSSRSLYQASNADDQDDPELSAYQNWVAELLAKLLCEAEDTK